MFPEKKEHGKPPNVIVRGVLKVLSFSFKDGEIGDHGSVGF